MPPACSTVSTVSSAGRPVFAWTSHGMPRPSSGDLDRAVGAERHVDARRVARERLVDRVVHDLVHEVVEAARSRAANVHAGALPHRLEPLEHRDLLGAALFCLSGKRRNQPDGRAASLLAIGRSAGGKQREVGGGRRAVSILFLLVVCVPLLCREKRATHGKATVKGDAEVIELAPLCTHAAHTPLSSS